LRLVAIPYSSFAFFSIAIFTDLTHGGDDGSNAAMLTKVLIVIGDGAR